MEVEGIGESARELNGRYPPFYEDSKMRMLLPYIRYDVLREDDC